MSVSNSPFKEGMTTTEVANTTQELAAQNAMANAIITNAEAESKVWDKGNEAIKNALGR